MSRHEPVLLTKRRDQSLPVHNPNIGRGTRTRHIRQGGPVIPRPPRRFFAIAGGGCNDTWARYLVQVSAARNQSDVWAKYSAQALLDRGAADSPCLTAQPCVVFRPRLSSLATCLYTSYWLFTKLFLPHFSFCLFYSFFWRRTT